MVKEKGHGLPATFLDQRLGLAGTMPPCPLNGTALLPPGQTNG